MDGEVSSGESSVKLIFISEILPEIIDQGESVLIFSKSIKMLDLVQDELRISNYKYVRIDGETKVDMRCQHVQDTSLLDHVKSLQSKSCVAGVTYHNKVVLLVKDKVSRSYSSGEKPKQGRPTESRTDRNRISKAAQGFNAGTHGNSSAIIKPKEEKLKKSKNDQRKLEVNRSHGYSSREKPKQGRPTESRTDQYKFLEEQSYVVLRSNRNLSEREAIPKVEQKQKPGRPRLSGQPDQEDPACKKVP